MNLPSYKFIAAVVVALVYMAIAAFFVRADRKPGTGGFITLQGMTSFIATMPISAPMEISGHKLDFRSNWQMAAAIIGCGALIFGLLLGLLYLVEFIWAALFSAH